MSGITAIEYNGSTRIKSFEDSRNGGVRYVALTRDDVSGFNWAKSVAELVEEYHTQLAIGVTQVNGGDRGRARSDRRASAYLLRSMNFNGSFSVGARRLGRPLN